MRDSPTTALWPCAEESCRCLTVKQTNYHQGSPALLKAIEIILASPADIKRKVQRAKQRHRLPFGFPESESQARDRIADRLIAGYSTKAGISGGATALIGIVPGIGTVAELFGGATADMALCLKYQVEMCMALACLYGHDIESESDRKKYFIIAGLGTLNTETFRQGSEQAAKLFANLAHRYLREATFDTLRTLFRKVSINLSRKALQKAIPFGIGAVVGFSSNKTLTWVVGRRAKTYFASTPAA